MADGTHPTGMLSCYLNAVIDWVDLYFLFARTNAIAITRMHSSGMRTARLLTVCRRVVSAGGCLPRECLPREVSARGCLPGEVSARGVSAWGVSALGVEGVCLGVGVSEWGDVCQGVFAWGCLPGGECLPWGVSAQGSVCLGVGGVCLGVSATPSGPWTDRHL